jgi:hypothetical protein
MPLVVRCGASRINARRFYASATSAIAESSLWGKVACDSLADFENGFV